MWNRLQFMLTRPWLLPVLVIALLCIGFGTLYFDDRAWGAWGDDSPGYIFAASRIYNGEPLVYTDPLAAEGFEFFGDEKLARWLTPTHHEFINTRGVIASEYPVGAGLLLAVTGWLTGSLEGMYLAMPVLAVLSVVLTYVLAVQLLPAYRFRHVVGAGAAIGMGLTTLFSSYASAHPMREIPSMALLLLSAVILVEAVRATKQSWAPWKQSVLIILSAASFGMAINIRETSILLVPAFLVYAFWSLWAGLRLPKKEKIRRAAAHIVLYAFVAAIALIPTVWTAINISQEREVFKARDTTEFTLLPNSDHLATLRLRNLFVSEGRFRPGKGAVPYYIELMNTQSAIPFFLAFAFFGFIRWWKRNKQGAALLGLWFLGIFGIFALWINPYSRYVLPLFPVLFILGTFGITELFGVVVPQMYKQKRVRQCIWGAALVALVFLYTPVVKDARTSLEELDLQHKSIAQTDYATLVRTNDDVRSAGGDSGILMFSGAWQYGTSEVMQAHTGLKTIRFPLEQKFTYDVDDVTVFMKKIAAEQPLFFWADSTTPPETFTYIAEHFNQEKLAEYDFTFQQDVQLFRLTSK